MAAVTIETIARETVAAIDSDTSYLLCAQWIARRYQQLCSRSRFRHLRQIGEVTLPGRIDTGTVTATRGSRIVTGNAAAQAVWTPDIVGRYFRARAAWYRISAVIQSTLRLEKEFAEADVAAVAYNIVSRRVHLDPNARWISEEFVHFRMRRPLIRKSIAELNMLAPERQLVGTPPYWWAEVGAGTDDEGRTVKDIECYPYPDNDELLGYVFWDAPPLLTIDDEIPVDIDPHVLREGALIDLMRYEMAKAMRAGQMEAAATWRNEMRTQMTSWERNILEAIRTDRGTDDVTFILTSPRGGAYGTDIVTARDEIFARGARP